MTAAAFALVIASAVLHAAWNFLLKRGFNKTAFFWCMCGTSALLVVPMGVTVAIIRGLEWKTLGYGVGTMVPHGFYAYTLARSYSVGDLSSVYPIARGMGPALVPLFAVILLGESVSALAVVGIVMVVAGIYATHIDTRFLRDLSHPLKILAAPATQFALLTGVIIAWYTLWDKTSIDADTHPLTVNGFAMAGNFIFLTPFALLAVERDILMREWTTKWRDIIAAGILAPLGYVLVLIALTTSRVSYIAPAREVGIVLGAALGVLVLGEGYGMTRIWGSVLIVAGCIVLGVAP
ncbi:MAG TPA: EamA family transporter [Dehalococcoidia bacterium]|nr:EamA family transporter [Dehalococcoidia bacterium]